MKRNKRDAIIVRAEVQLRMAIQSISEDYDLTISELMLILTDTTSKLYRTMVRSEQNSEE